MSVPGFVPPMIPSKLEQCLAGLQVGMFGGAALLSVMTVVPVLDHQPWWTYSNLLSACFYGVRSINGGVGWPTLSGAAFQLVIAGAGGVLFGFVFGRYATSRRIAVLSLAWGLFVFFVSEQFYRIASPVVAAYLPRSAGLVAHMIYGACLAGIGRIGLDHSQAAQPMTDVAVHGTPVATSALGAAPQSHRTIREVAPGEVETENAAVDEPAGKDVDSHG